MLSVRQLCVKCVACLKHDMPECYVILRISIAIALKLKGKSTPKITYFQ